MGNGTQSPFDINFCARPNILALQPYRCARDDYADDGVNILLDANENAIGPGLAIGHRSTCTNGFTDHGAHGLFNKDPAELDLSRLNRYPDPHQIELKKLLCKYRNTHHHTNQNLTPDNLFVGVGSDEAIDALLRCFCTPGKDKILTCPPTYGMYAVSAQVNDLEIVKIPLDIQDSFALRPHSINEALSADPTIKIVYITSPGNPTAACIPKSALQPILEHPTWNGIIVLDEAYIDFSPPGASLAEWVLEWPNLVILQTLSKAFGLAGIRLGTAFTSPPIARLLNNLKAPYNISTPTSALACAALQPASLDIMRSNLATLVQQRERMLAELPKIPGVGRFLGGRDANFLLTEILDGERDRGGKPSNEVALAVYERLAEKKGIVVRFRGREEGCLGCLRITVGTEAEVDRLLREMRAVLEELLKSGGSVYTGEGGIQLRQGGKEEVEREVDASQVVT